MSIKKIIFLAGLSVLFAGCSTTRFGGSDTLSAHYSDASTAMGVRYLLGRGVPQADAKAFQYFSEAADNDDPFAENEVAYMYAAGKGTTKDYTKAFFYYQKAANHGLGSAEYNLGLLYLKGLGTKQDPVLAAQWFKKSAARGFQPANRLLSS
ncbi:MAG: hypothetical protein A3F13_07225 [Gammaproteobacteria bacterium RIFCSPHIGHO2_12_FULL_40_19]|nr:MAG: hypothetical protein A3F13_07225 [Gammaproteobacteria bacterium RIFCSPHIGHO2_12_FULL_40_19]HLB43473.1 tetratricopeptide repeat protein [Gammaproteobacteria bacterium]